MLRQFASALITLMVVWTQVAFAHDIPVDVRVQVFSKPEGQRRLMLLRVPLGAKNEVDMPLRGPGYLDLARADAALRVAGERWFADNLTMLEDGRPPPRPHIDATRVSLASDRSFSSWDAALAHLRSPHIAPTTDLHWKQQHFDLLLSFPISSVRARFTVDARLARMGLKVVTTLRFVPPRRRRACL